MITKTHKDVLASSAGDRSPIGLNQRLSNC